MSHKRSILRLVFLVVLFGAGCAYGMLAERHELFPFTLVRRVATALRGGDGSGAPGMPRTGRWSAWRPCEPGAELTEEQRAEVERLRSIGYLTGSALAGDCQGVIAHAPDRASQGLNLLVSGHRAWAGLMDMNGELVHEWALPFDEAWPSRQAPAEATGDEYWRRVHLLPDGGLLAIYEGLGLVRVDRRSNLVWAAEGGYHHDIAEGSDGRFYVLDREPAIIPRISRTEPVLEDFVAVLDADGKVLRRFSLLEAFERSPYRPILARMNWKGDLFHTNTIEVLDGRLAGRNPAFRVGNLLISVLMLDTVAVVDPDTETIVWALTGLWRQQHQPTVLANGRMLVFDNKAGPSTSQVVELDPFTQEVAWSYRGSEVLPFYTETCGSNQRLPNGNTLITESDNGRAFEVTPEGLIVWEYVNPHRAGPEKEFIATLFEVVRMPPGWRPSWLD